MSVIVKRYQKNVVQFLHRSYNNIFKALKVKFIRIFIFCFLKINTHLFWFSLPEKSSKSIIFSKRSSSLYETSIKLRLTPRGTMCLIISSNTDAKTFAFMFLLDMSKLELPKRESVFSLSNYYSLRYYSKYLRAHNLIMPHYILLEVKL